MKTFLSLPLLSVALSCASDVSAQAPVLSAQFTDTARADKVATTATAVSSLYESFYAKAGLPGLVYGIVLDDKLVYSGGFGYTDLAHKTPADAHSLFRVASMSKNFTAVAILQLRDRGLLRLDDPVSLYVPEAANLVAPTADSPPVTLRHLLTHGAGLPEDNPWGDRQLAMSDDDLTALLRAGPSFSRAPDIHYEYSNLGFALLGRVIENVSGLSFEQYTTRNILEPLGMRDTVWEVDKADDKRMATGYDRANGPLAAVTPEHHGAFGPMGGLITSVQDFARFASLHLSAWPPRDGSDDGVLKRSSLREMHQPLRLNQFVANGACPFVLGYSFGLTWAQECDTPPYLSHNGGLPGFTGNWIFVPELGLAVMAFSNITYESLTPTNRTVVKQIIRQAGLQPRALPVPPLLDQRHRQLTEYLFDWNQAESSGIFAGNFFRDLDVTTRNARGRKLRESMGEIRETGPMQADNQLRGHFIVKGSKRDASVFFSMTPEPVPRIQAVETTLLDAEAERR
ncbi:MAG TPA: serine hydrolase domain-containing protein [Candidatus Acidoferrum sp.]|nr:serine hydrolase domain-containing protein [Candidatus Acidoferrum sp.]